jgi:CubicO group peptidase (beta-lactamase class C family)
MMTMHGGKGMGKLTSGCTAAIPFRPLLTLLLIIGAPLASVFTQQSQRDFEPLEKAALDELRESNTPGAALAVVSGDRIVYVKGLGLSNVETGAPVTPEMLFRIGSVTKMFTAALLATLAEDGKIKLDEPIGKYVRGLSPKLSQVTSQQLLSGTAGLIDGEPLYGPQDESALAKTVRSWNDDIFFLEPGQALFIFGSWLHHCRLHVFQRLRPGALRYRVHERRQNRWPASSFTSSDRHDVDTSR